ncbi:hypothetical protein CWS43_12075 [Rahnella sp. AA]|uniref:glycerate kinase n=1 Tax=Rahnella sp. AA TaxID=2057180 RepID=UPI000C3434C5|nr:glycerate kinase [Rahnella sp. AA]PKE30356.1 hypothetical protein CWS43_12075 [Rahnella sp. AA]
MNMPIKERMSLINLATTGKDVIDVPVAGAGDGIGAGLLAFTHCEMRAGIDIVVQATDLKKQMAGSDFCIT